MAPKPRKPGSLSDDPAFRGFVLGLQRAIPPADPSAESARLGDRAPAAPEALPPQRATQQLMHESLGAFDRAWPAQSRAELLRLSEGIRAVCMLWGAQAGSRSDEARRAAESLRDRRDAAIRLVSAMLYSAARSASMPEGLIDEVAVLVAQELSVELFGDLSAVFAVPRGTFVEAEHELIGPGHPSARIRALTFGIRARGRIASKASVEADAPAGVRP